MKHRNEKGIYMKATTKNSLLTLAIALMLMGCSNANKLIVPNGLRRVPINQGQGVVKAPVKQADTHLVTESAAIREAESLKEKVAQLQQDEQAASTRIASLEIEFCLLYTSRCV